MHLAKWESLSGTKCKYLSFYEFSKADYVKPSGSQQHYLCFLKDLVGLRAELRAHDDVSVVNSVKKT